MGEGVIMSVSTVTVTVAPDVAASLFITPTETVKILLRCPTANTQDVFVNLGILSATTGDLRIRAGESVWVDITNILMLKTMLGRRLTEKDFINKVSFITTVAPQVLYIDVLTL